MRLHAAWALACLCLCGSVSATDTALEYRRLQIEQQHDALNLNLQQSLGARRHDLDPADARRLETLQLRQRMDYQQLEAHQLQRDRALRHVPGPSDDVRERRLEMQRDLFAQERQLMLQRFELDQHRLLQAAPRQPLQPMRGTGQLRLR
jgi:hypothetical protein